MNPDLILLDGPDPVLDEPDQYRWPAGHWAVWRSTQGHLPWAAMPAARFYFEDVTFHETAEKAAAYLGARLPAKQGAP